MNWEIKEEMAAFDDNKLEWVKVEFIERLETCI